MTEASEYANICLALRETARNSTSASGGIGRLAGFRCQCSQGRAGSTPASRTTSEQSSLCSDNFFIKSTPETERLRGFLCLPQFGFLFYGGVLKHQAFPQWMFRHSPADTPSSFLNTREKWAVSAYPTCSATSLMRRAGSAISRLACWMRTRLSKS